MFRGDVYVFGYDLQVILVTATIFVAASSFMSLILIMAFDAKEHDTLTVLTMIASIIGLVVALNYPEKIVKVAEQEEYLTEQVAALLNVEESDVEETTLRKPSFDFTLKVDKNLVGIEYDFDNEEIMAIVSNDKYLYEKPTK